MTHYLRSFLVFLIAYQVNAQVVVTPSNDIPVFINAETQLLNPWTGGVNAAQISTLDIDQDGQDDDLLVFDKAGNKTLVFNGIWNNGVKEYAFSPDLSNQMPDVFNFVLLRVLYSRVVPWTCAGTT